MKAVLEMKSPKVLVEEIYILIKGCVKTGFLGQKHLDAIVELTTELANRLKVEEACEESEG